MATWRRRGAAYLRTLGARMWALALFSLGAWALAIAGGVAALLLVLAGVLLLPAGVGALGLSGWRWAVHGVAAGQRSLGRRLLGADTPPLEPVRLEVGTGRWRGAVRRRRRLLNSERLWRETGYQYLAWVLLLLSAAVVAVQVVAPVMGVGILVSVAVQGGGPKLQMLGLLLLGLAVLVVPAVLGVEAGVRRLTEWGLGPSARHRLEERVATLERTRRVAVAAAEDERRRLERDLHDGAQAGMVAVALQLGLVSDAIRSRRAGPDEAETMVEEARRLALNAIEQVRTLARGLHPSVLSARGLAAALAGLAAEAPLPVSVSCEDDLGTLAPESEAAAYFCAAELLANVYKHAHAGSAAVSLGRRDDRVELVVADDGSGGARIRPGGGLQGLVDRLAALDGRLDVAQAGRGTVVRVSIPVLSPDADRLAAAAQRPAP